jgi:hypothetical protein
MPYHSTRYVGNERYVPFSTGYMARHSRASMGLVLVYWRLMHISDSAARNLFRTYITARLGPQLLSCHRTGHCWGA